MFTLDKVSNMLNAVINSMKVPALTLPPSLLYCISFKRTGLSVAKITSQIISRNAETNIPTGKNPDGSENLINQLVYNIVEGIVEGLKKDGSVQIVVPKDSIMVKVEGFNAGGPIVAVGKNILSTLGKGIIQ